MADFITIPFILFVFIVQFCSFFVKGLAGFGDPLISNPLLSLSSLENSQITPVNLLMQWPLNLYIAVKNRKAFSIKDTLPIIVCILAGMIPGMLCLKYGSSWILKAALGILIIAMGIEMLTRKESVQSSGNPVLMAVSSFASGFTSGLFGINLFFVAYIERTGYVNRQQFRGQMCFVFFIENTVRFFLYVLNGFYTFEVLQISFISMFGVAAGMFAGSRVDHNLDEATVRRIITIVFICAGISTLVKALIVRG